MSRQPYISIKKVPGGWVIAHDDFDNKLSIAINHDDVLRLVSRFLDQNTDREET